jgi:Cof subfamily protein (haloacid dehalogenase superfamily)
LAGIQVQPPTDLGERLPPAVDLGYERSLPPVKFLRRGVPEETPDVGNGDACPTQEGHHLGLPQLGVLVVAVSRRRIHGCGFKDADVGVVPKHSRRQATAVRELADRHQGVHPCRHAASPTEYRHDMNGAIGGGSSCSEPHAVTAVVSDLDGTLLRSNGHLSSSSLTAIEQARSSGLFFLAATARTPRGLRRVPGIEHLGIVVCANGAVVWNAASDLIWEQACFDPSRLRAAVAWCREARPSLCWAYLSPDTMYADAAYLATRTKRHDAELVLDVTGIGDEEPLVAAAVREAGKAAVSFFDLVASGFAGVGTPSLACVPTLDVAPLGVSKATAVARVLRRFGHEPTSTVVFGDMPNDLPLFRWAGRSVATANADPTVLSEADEVIGHCDDDSVALAILRLAATTAAR